MLEKKYHILVLSDSAKPEHIYVPAITHPDSEDAFQTILAAREYVDWCNTNTPDTKFHLCRIDFVEENKDEGLYNSHTIFGYPAISDQ